MVYTNELGCKEYEKPKMKVVMINTADIIATSNPDDEGTGGEMQGPGGWG